MTRVQGDIIFKRAQAKPSRKEGRVVMCDGVAAGAEMDRSPGNVTVNTMFHVLLPSGDELVVASEDGRLGDIREPSLPRAVPAARDCAAGRPRDRPLPDTARRVHTPHGHRRCYCRGE